MQTDCSVSTCSQLKSTTSVCRVCRSSPLSTSDIFELIETAFYKTKLQDFGIILDTRANYTKSDWEIWVAAISDKELQSSLVDRVARYSSLADPKNAGMPFGDFYDVPTGTSRDFRARPVVGGHFAILALTCVSTGSHCCVPYLTILLVGRNRLAEARRPLNLDLDRLVRQRAPTGRQADRTARRRSQIQMIARCRHLVLFLRQHSSSSWPWCSCSDLSFLLLDYLLRRERDTASFACPHHPSLVTHLLISLVTSCRRPFYFSHIPSRLLPPRCVD